ncbi:MAG: outer membrane protein assembly factor [Rhodothermaceae bacterium]
MTHRFSKKIFFFLIFLSLHTLSAQKITKIDIDSGQMLPESVLDNINQKFLNSDFNPAKTDSLFTFIYNEFSNQGYYSARFIDQKIEFNEDSSEVELTFNFEAGEATVINSVSFSNEFPELKTIATQYKNEILSSLNLHLLTEKLLTSLEQKGFSFAKIEIKSVLINQNKADIYLEISQGIKSVIDKIVVTGTTSTENYVILRELPFREGDLFDEPQLEEAHTNLIRLNYFKTVSPLQYKILPDGKGIIEIEVEEKNTNNFDGIAGYVPKTKTEDGYFTGFVNISMRNLFGTGRMGAVRWKQFNRNSQELELKYREPWLFNFPVSVGLELYQKKQDTTYVKRYLSAEISYLISNKIKAGFIFETESVIPTLKEPPVFTVYNSSIITTGINLTIDTRNDFLAPKSGFYLSNNFKYSSKSINGPKEFITNISDKNIEIKRFEIDFEYYKTFSLKHTLVLKLGGREVRSDLTESSDNYFIGGNNTLRGYREKQFSGNRVFWSNLEYRYSLEDRSFLFLFFDTGYFQLDKNQTAGTPEISDFITGYGGGISLETSLGLMSISYALGKEDTFTQGKIHIGLINEF